MINHNPNWDDLGRTIQDAVDWAVNSRDYRKLNQTIRQVVEAAVDVGGEALRKAAKTTQQTAQTVTNAVTVRRLYGSTGGTMAKGVVKSVFGGGIALVSAIGVMGTFMLGLMHPGFWTAFAVFAVGLAGGGWMTASGVKNIGMVRRFQSYRRMLGTKTTCAIEKLGRSVGKTAQFVRDDLYRMFGRGFFLEGHLDREQTMLITSDETYRLFEQSRLAMEEQQKQAAAAKAKAEASQPDPRLREVLEKGNSFIAQIRKCNDDIPGEEISAKISHMELIVRRIFQRAESCPEIVPDLKKLMDYYLPMTVKLLNAYADMDAQPVQGETIQASKREIEATLDTLNRAFEKLLDDLFADTAMDVSSDISVLNTMLAQEGLAEDELEKLRKKQNL